MVAPVCEVIPRLWHPSNLQACALHHDAAHCHSTVTANLVCSHCWSSRLPALMLQLLGAFCVTFET